MTNKIENEPKPLVPPRTALLCIVLVVALAPLALAGSIFAAVLLLPPSFVLVMPVLDPVCRAVEEALWDRSHTPWSRG